MIGGTAQNGSSPSKILKREARTQMRRAGQDLGPRDWAFAGEEGIAMGPMVHVAPDAMARVCREYPVKELSVFGSVGRDGRLSAISWERGSGSMGLPEAQGLIEFADADLKAAMADLRADLYLHACIQAQQSAEKAVKAILAAYKIVAFPVRMTWKLCLSR